MTIKNRDGTNFQLVKPNPLRINQNIWNSHIMHNKFGKIVVVSSSEEAQQDISDDYMQEIGEDRVQIWCLPAHTKEFTDSLYNEKYVKVRYGKKFIFSGILIEMADLSMILWTDTRAVTEGSVVYPRVKDKRWWRVQEVKADDKEGYLLRCVVTNYQPDFSG
jgi:hypothetical protein